MRKIFAIVMLMVSAAIFSMSCGSCHREDAVVDDTTAYEVTGLDVDGTNSMDNEYMSANYGEYRWLECCIDAEDWMDESDVFNVKGIANIYAVVEISPDSMSGTMIIHMFAHTADTIVHITKEGLWVGDDPMNKYCPMNVDFAHAYDAMMRANCPKPHSRHCVLRKEVGENDIEPIYIFGNQDEQVYVSSVSCCVTTTNPAYNDGGEGMRFGTTLTR